MKWLLITAISMGAVSTLLAQDKGRDSVVKVLTEVTVSARSPTIRNGPDKKVFAVNQSLVSLGGSAADLLQNVPYPCRSIRTANVSLRGATDLKVLVDGKRSLIGGGGTIAQVLQSIPASSIDRVEIITNPGAKYDAEGLALINIVLKKNNAAGFNGSVAVTGGTRDNYNAATSISYQNSRIYWYGNYSYQHRNTYSNGFQNMTYLLSPVPSYYSDETFPSTTITDLHFGQGRVGLYFFRQGWTGCIRRLQCLIHGTQRVADGR